ncbi:hypothetical protein EIP86_007744 [Pleurotus ostreatoroseus]|nr:hypothetical protein EIP86_007744 [Pleurotus ostreatoroseus]
MSKKKIDEANEGESDDEFERATKKQRLSSPTYDDQFELSEDLVAAFDNVDRTYSQAMPIPPRSQPRPPQARSQSGREIRLSQISNALKGQGKQKDDLQAQGLSRAPLTIVNAPPEHFHRSYSHSQSSDTRSTSHIPSSSQNAIECAQISSSPVICADQEDSNFFQSTNLLIGGSAKENDLKASDDNTFLPEPLKSSRNFMSASHLAAEDEPVGFTTGNTWNSKNFMQPSAAAMAQAEARMKKWDREATIQAMDVDEEDDPFGVANASQESPLKQRSNMPPPGQPLPSFGTARAFATSASSGFAPASQQDRTASTSSAVPVTPTPASRGFHPPGPSAGTSGGTKAFQSPLSAKPAPASGEERSPPNSGLLSRPTGFAPASSSNSASKFATPLKTAPQPRPSTFSTPVPKFGLQSATATERFSTPVKSLGTTPKRTPVSQKPFKTPFKKGFGPDEPGRAMLDAQKKSFATRDVSDPSSSRSGKSRAGGNFFNLTKPAGRQTLASCGLRPQKYTSDELELMGIGLDVLLKMMPQTAPYYTFHTATTRPVYATNTQLSNNKLGPSAALDELKSLGCKLATEEWVLNHWTLILWKLAGMVCLDPQAEDDDDRKRWCWPEVIRQLRYRYEREINRGQRPIFRQIVAQDLSPSVPMILCVSGITEVKGGGTAGGSLIEEIEVTDGWYRLKAEVDEPLERAIVKRKIRVGSKIQVVGCKLQSERKEGGEILEVGESTSLTIYGNSSQLAPWYAKLGVQKQLCISTLGSLDPLGGLVSTIEIVVTNAYPIAYLEFTVTPDGRKTQGAPVGEKEEAEIHEKWVAKRDNEARKLREEYGGQLRRFTDYIEQLERKAGSTFNPSDDGKDSALTSHRLLIPDLFASDSPPDHIDDLVVELEDAKDVKAGREIIRHLNSIEAGWLARAAAEKRRRDEELMAEYIERDLNHTCPPRNVRSFRIIAGRDARTEKHPAQREVQITVWDVMSIQLEEDGAFGDFRVGQHLRVSASSEYV